MVIDFAIETLGVRRLEARAAADNSRANGALRKLGAVQEGVLRRCFLVDGQYRDHTMWSILADEWASTRVAVAAACEPLGAPPEPQPALVAVTR